MRKRYDHEPERGLRGKPTCGFEDLEVDQGDPLRPAYTYVQSEAGMFVAFEPHAPSVLAGQPDEFVLQSDIFATSPYTVALVFENPEDAWVYDIRAAETASFARRFIGFHGQVNLTRMGTLMRPAYRRKKSIVKLEMAVAPMAVFIWPNQALNRSQLEEILASPGEFFRHLRLSVPKTTRFSGATNETTGRVT